MAKFKDIVENSPLWAKMRFVDIVNMMDISKTNKYSDMIMRVLVNHQSTLRYDEYDIKHSREFLIQTFNIDTEGMDDVSIILMRQKLDIFNRQDLQMIRNFMSLNEAKVLGGIDVSTVKTLQDIHNYTSLASLKSIGKEFRKQVKIDYEDSEWMILRPFSFEASCKYGAGTKWCTTSDSNPDHFFRYTKNGVLIYVINKKTGDKVGCFKNIGEITSEFYNIEDIRVDSMDTNLPYEILQIVRELFKTEKYPNKYINEKVWNESFSRNHELHVKRNNLTDAEPMSIEEVAVDMAREIDHEVMETLNESLPMAVPSVDGYWDGPMSA
jgi:hypothetical protein